MLSTNIAVSLCGPLLHTPTKFVSVWMLDMSELAEQNEDEAQQETSFIAREVSRAVGMTGSTKKQKGTHHIQINHKQNGRKTMKFDINPNGPQFQCQQMI